MNPEAFVVRPRSSWYPTLKVIPANNSISGRLFVTSISKELFNISTKKKYYYVIYRLIPNIFYKRRPGWEAVDWCFFGQTYNIEIYIYRPRSSSERSYNSPGRVMYVTEKGVLLKYKEYECLTGNNYIEWK